MTEIIDMTPSWRGILGYLIVGIENGNAEGRKIATEELRRMADIADSYNVLINKLTVDNLAQVIREVDGNNDLGAGKLAEAILEKIND